MNQAFTQEQFAATQKNNIETFLSFADTAVTNAERLAALNVKTASEAIRETATNAKNLLISDGFQQFMSIQATQPQKAFEQWAAYFNSFRSISDQTQKVFSRLIESQMTNVNNSLSATLGEFARSASSDVAASAFKSVVAAATTTCDSLSKTAQEVANLAEAQVAAVTDATAQAIAAAGNKQPERKQA